MKASSSNEKELKNRVTEYGVIKTSYVKLCSFFITDKDKISELCKSKIASLFNNNKIPELRNSGILSLIKNSE